MQLWPFISHSGFLLESRFSDFFKFAIFSTKISLFLQIHFNLLEDKHSFGYFWTPKSTYDICSVFLYMLSYTLSPKNSKIEILFCQTLRPECIGIQGIQTSNLLQNAQVKSSKMTQIFEFFSLSTPLPYLIGVATYNNENWSSIGHLHQMAYKMGTG